MTSGFRTSSVAQVDSAHALHRVTSAVPENKTRPRHADLAESVRGLAAERGAIVALQPPFNKQHNRDHEGRREAYWRWTARAEQSGPFKELYASLQGRLPLYCMSDDDGRVQLTTTPEHWNVVKHINIDDPRHVSIPVSWDGQRIGTVIPANFHFHGPMLWLAFTKRTPHLDRKGEMMFARLVMNAKKGGTPVLAIKRIWIEK